MKDLELGDAMREGMRRLASGVCVLATRNAAGVRFAMTASSVTSVSDSPASLLVCVNTATGMYQAMESGGSFSVNVLSYSQEDISNLCGGGEEGEGRFLAGAWETCDRDGLPYLADAQAIFFCEQDTAFVYGTHRIVVGKITHIMVDEGEIDPLIYLNGQYCRV